MMQTSRYWWLFAISAIAWMVISVILPPQSNGPDVMYFRDPGWNLAVAGHFDGVGLLYTPDLTPKFFAHYTPAMPLLFAAFLAVFPHNDHAGTIFNLFLGLLAAGTALFWVTRNAANGRIKRFAAFAIALFPVAFIVYDRPESLSYVVACAVIAYAARPTARPVFAGILVGLTFLAEPIAAVIVSMWVAGLFLFRNWPNAARYSRTLLQVSVAAASSVAVLLLTILVYEALDPSAPMRFVTHAIGPAGSGLGRLRGASLLQQAKDFWFINAFRARGPSLLLECGLIFPGVIFLAFAVWVAINRRKFRGGAAIVVCTALVSVCVTVLLYPFEPLYLNLLVFLVPTGLLIVSRRCDEVRTLGPLLLLISVLTVNLPDYAINLLLRVEGRASYVASRQQASYLASNLASANGLVGFRGEYDLYKPVFNHVFNAMYIQFYQEHISTASVAALANCYAGLTGGPGSVLPLPGGFSPADFHLIQAAPAHMWITVFGHRISDTQRGYGCDLYVRNAPSSHAPHGF